MAQTVLVRRPLTDAEMAAIMAAIKSAEGVGYVVVNALEAWFNALLRPLGQSWDDFTPDNMLDPMAFQVPRSQSAAIFDAAMARARELHRDPDAAVHVALTLMNISPSHYED